MDDVTGLAERGLSIYRQHAGQDATVNALALEAARAADRLDELDRIIQGKGVLELMQFRLKELPSEPGESGEPFVVEVKFQAVLAEARGQQANFAALTAKLLALTSSQTQTAPAGRAANVTPLEAVRAARG